MTNLWREVAFLKATAVNSPVSATKYCLADGRWLGVRPAPWHFYFRNIKGATNRIMCGLRSVLIEITAKSGTFPQIKFETMAFQLYLHVSIDNFTKIHAMLRIPLPFPSFIPLTVTIVFHKQSKCLVQYFNKVLHVCKNLDWFIAFLL